MLEAVDAFCNFEVYPSIVDVGHKIIFFDEFLRNHVDLDADILRTVQRRVKIEVVDIRSEEFGLWSGADTVDYPFDHLNRACFSARVAKVSNGVATNGDTGSIRI